MQHHLWTLQFLRVRQIWVRVSDCEVALMASCQALRHGCTVLEYWLVSNGMDIVVMLGLTNCCHRLIALAVYEFLVLRDGRLQRWLCVWHDELFDHRDRLAGFEGLTTLRRSSDEVLYIALLTELWGRRLKWRRICSRIVFRLRDVLTPVSSVGNPLDVVVVMRSVGRGSNLVHVLLYVLSVDLLQHVIIQGLIRIDEDRKKKCVCWNNDYTLDRT